MCNKIESWKKCVVAITIYYVMNLFMSLSFFGVWRGILCGKCEWHVVMRWRQNKTYLPRMCQSTFIFYIIKEMLSEANFSCRTLWCWSKWLWATYNESLSCKKPCNDYHACFEANSRHSCDSQSDRTVGRFWICEFLWKVEFDDDGSTPTKKTLTGKCLLIYESQNVWGYL